jgi:hypothetical protein
MRSNHYLILLSGTISLKIEVIPSLRLIRSQRRPIHYPLVAARMMNILLVVVFVASVYWDDVWTIRCHSLRDDICFESLIKKLLK